tara:strand:- start:67 stop:666 length:600 start_codon:yes stop_codon:yes gene_type:complete
MSSTIIKNNKLLIIISSPSGTGKTSVCKRIINHDKKIKLSVSHTTRTPRDNEINGLDYFFISSDDFNSKILDKSFLEYAYVFGNYYGTSKKNVQEILLNDCDVLFDIDWQGASQISNSNLARIVTIFLVPPSKDEVLERLKKRSKETGDDHISIQRRMLEYENEMKHASEYSYVVVNNEIEDCTKKVISIIENERKLSD